MRFNYNSIRNYFENSDDGISIDLLIFLAIMVNFNKS